MINHLLKYLFLISNLLTSIISYKLLTKDKMYINIKNILILFFLNAISLIIRYYNNAFLILISNIAFIVMIIKCYFKQKMNKVLFYSILISIISLLCDAIIPTIISNKYLLNVSIFQKSHYFRMLLNIPVCIAIILVSAIPIIKNVSKKLFDKYFSKIKLSKVHCLFFFTIVLIFLIAFCLNAYNEVDRVGHLIILLGIFSFTLLFIVTLYLLYQEYQIKNLNKNIIEENKYIKEIAKQDAEFKHNLINNLLGIKTISNKKTNKLIDCLIEEYQLDYSKITNINDLPSGVQSIIYRKAYEENIEDLNLIVNNYIREEIYDVLTPKKYNHLCTSIGILFDNALEAVKNNFEKVIEINFEEDQEYIYFVLKNSFSNILDLEETGKRNYTTKKTGHGIGLNYIKKLRTLEMKQEIINNTFIINLKIKKTKKI